jgi:hypothetical protein
VSAAKAIINYVRPSPERPRADSEDPSRSVMPLAQVPVEIEDVRAAAPSLDQEGFALVRHESRVSDFGDESVVDGVYLPEAEALVKAASGADRAWALPRPVLRSERHGESEGAVIRDRIAMVAHIDYSPVSIPALVAAAAQRRGETAPPWRRLILYTVWRSLRPPPQDRPLALCDLSTVAAQDLVPADAIANPGALAYSAEFLMLLPSERHRWCYFPDMLPDEALVFQQLDSAATGPSGCPHTSFLLAGAAVPAPRLSIEARVCAFFDA